MKFHAMLFSEVIRKMKIGYARVSTTDQNLESQIEALTKEGCEKIFQEKSSGSSRDREELKQALSILREGDTFVVTKLDRLGRTVKQLVDLFMIFKNKKFNSNQSMMRLIQQQLMADSFFIL